MAHLFQTAHLVSPPACLQQACLSGQGMACQRCPLHHLGLCLLSACLQQACPSGQGMACQRCPLHHLGLCLLFLPMVRRPSTMMALMAHALQAARLVSPPACLQQACLSSPAMACQRCRLHRPRRFSPWLHRPQAYRLHWPRRFSPWLHRPRACRPKARRFSPWLHRPQARRFSAGMACRMCRMQAACLRDLL